MQFLTIEIAKMSLKCDFYVLEIIQFEQLKRQN